MVPNISQEVVLQLKNLKPGNCIAFGMAFKVPITMYIDLPDPRPLSNNVDLENVWYNEIAEETNDGAGLKLGVNTPQNSLAGMNMVQEVRPMQNGLNQQILGSNNRMMPQQQVTAQYQQMPQTVAVRPNVQPTTQVLGSNPQQAMVRPGTPPMTSQQAPQPNINMMQPGQNIQNQ